MTRFTLTAGAVMFGLAACGVALAADDTPAPASGDHHTGGFRQACGADLQTYCSSSKTHEERHACIEANKDKFSDTCKTYMAQHPHGHGGAPTTP
jgi:hypothetical protein